MIEKGRLTEISELKLAGKLEQMDDGGFKDYVQLLDSFADDLPEMQVKIKAALETKDYKALEKRLTTLRDVLQKIYAEDMARDCAEQITGLGNVKHEKLEAFITSFLANLSVLSIEIQMAQQNVVTTATSAKNAQDAGPAQEKKILAVDDTPFFLSILKKVLQDTKYKLTCVVDGRDALNYLEKYTPDLFLLDIVMPGMDGYELAEKIREKGIKAPIIFLTGSALKENVTKALKAGAADFIIKPINKSSLLAKIDKHIYMG